MAGIIYTAVDRGKLITDSPAHVAGTSYSIDVKLPQHSEIIETPKVAHVSIGGTVETVLKRAEKLVYAGFIFPYSSNADIEEWLYSIAGGEIFSFDPYGTIATPVDAQDVVCLNGEFTLGRMQHGATPWRSVGMTLRFRL